MKISNYMIRANHIRKMVLDAIYSAEISHIGSALSCVDIFTALYAVVDLQKIQGNCLDRDRIILSKGHGIAAQLSALCEYGLLSREDIISGFCRPGSVFPENTAAYTPYIEVPTGSLGQGASFAVGAAYGMKLRNFSQSRVFAILGDGELNEGQCWEAFQQASYHRLDNLVVFIDANGLAGINETCGNKMLLEKMRAFGFQTEAIDGHDVDGMIAILKRKNESSKPMAYICNTVKGYGISFMENDNDWHYRPMSELDYLKALEEIG